MSKYYIRYNPQSRFLPGVPSWIVLEINGDSVVRHLASDVKLEVNSWTEKSAEDQNWWNLACEGYMLKDGQRIRIVPSV